MSWPFNVTVDTPDPPDYTAAVNGAKASAQQVIASLAQVKQQQATIVAELRGFTFPGATFDGDRQAKLQHVYLVANDYVGAAQSYLGALANWQENAPVRLALGLPLIQPPAPPMVPDLTV